MRFGRWHWYLHHLGETVSWRDNLKAFLSSFVLTTTPGKVGESVKAYFLQRSSNVDPARSLAGLFAERFTNVFPVVLVICVEALFASAGPVDCPRNWRGADRQDRSAPAPRWVRQALLLPLAGWSAARRWVRPVDTTLSDTSSLLQPRVLLGGILLGGLLWIGEGVAMYILFDALGGEAVALHEAASVSLSLLYDATQTQAVVATVLIRLLALWSTILIGVIFIVQKIFVVKHKYTNIFLSSILVLITISSFWLSGYSEGRFKNPDSYDYAQIGRELRKGNGFSTLQIFPRHVSYLNESGYLKNERWPNFHRYPLPTLTVSGLYYITEDTVKASITYSGIFYILSSLLLFIFSWHSYGYKIALCTLLVYVSDPGIWFSSYSGLTEPQSTFLIISSIISLNIPIRNVFRVSTCGLFVGLSFLTRTNLIILIPSLFIYMYFKGGFKKRAYFILLFSFSATISPWLIRNYTLTGNPTFSFSNTRNIFLGVPTNHSDLDMVFGAPVRTTSLLGKHFTGFVSKYLHNLYECITSPSSLLGNNVYVLMFVFYILSGFLITKNIFKHSLDKFFVSIFALNTLVICAAFLNGRFFKPIYPFIILMFLKESFSLVGFLLKRTRIMNSILVIVVVLSVSSWFVYISPHKSDINSNIRKGIDCEKIGLNKKTQKIVLSDISHKLSLNCNVRSIRLPAKPSSIPKIDRKIDLDVVYISKRIWKLNTSKEPFEDYSSYREIEKNSVSSIVDNVLSKKEQIRGGTIYYE